MKNLIGMMGLGLVLVTTSAFAYPLQNVASATLTKFDVDGRSDLPLDPVSGSITLNRTANTANLYLDTCPIGAMCIIGGRSIELPIVSETTNRCGITTIKAERNLLAVDGDDEIMTITDNSKSVCRLMTEAPTVITLEIIGSRQAGPSFTTLSKFLGNKLELMMY